MSERRRVALSAIGPRLDEAIRGALQRIGLLDRLTPESRIALKPNLTYPYHRAGITTSPQVMRETVRVLRDYSQHIAIVETDGGYGAWRAAEAFAGHGLYELQKEFGIDIVNLNDEARELISFRVGLREHRLPLPTRLLKETDVFITMPVPKIHCMTGVSLAYKNQWGCVPDIMRLRLHCVFDDGIVAINRALRPAVLSDGTYFLNRTGPMEGDPVEMNLIIAADSAGSFDRYVSELMGVLWHRVGHLRRAVHAGDMPASLAEIEFDIEPAAARTQVFHLERTLRNYIALAGFKSRFLTWFGYESWLGRSVLHSILYAIAGKPVKPQP
jgi:uncharacterized protein (DUF362 family)